jgi:Holliday junction resolvase RusA-like endonuclease
MPGFNELIAAAMTHGFRKKGKVYNTYTYIKKLWTNRVCAAILENNICAVDKVFVFMIWFERNKRRDPDNIAAFMKFIFDGLQKAKIIKNDGWKEIVGWENTFEISDKRGVKVRLIDGDEYERKRFKR